MLFKEYLFFREHPDALRLHLHEDKVEILHTKRSRLQEIKLCAFYYTFGNFSGKYNYPLKNIHYTLLVPYSHVKQFCLDVMLKPMIDASNEQLPTEGFTVSVCGFC